MTAAALSETELDLVRSVARAHAGLSLPPAKSYLVQARLAGLARREGLPSLKALLGHLRGPAAPAWSHKIGEALLTHESSFFRDPQIFEMLADAVLPRLREARSSVRRLTILSAGCAAGQEPYSLAIFLRNRFPDLCGWQLRIVGGDVSGPMIDQARAGRFSALDVRRGLSPADRDRYLKPAGADWDVRETVRAMVEFHRWNLAGPWPALPPVDLALARNVLMYLEPAARRETLRRIRQALVPDGYMLLGPSDALPVNLDLFDTARHGRTVYYRPRPAAAAALTGGTP